MFQTPADDTEDVALNFGEEEDLLKQKNVRHPIAVGFHLLFRTLAILIYLFCGFMFSNFIASFVFVVLTLSMDFWTVKNITGRLMVGLRWWNYVDEDGKSHWVFESRKGSAQKKITATESRIFWLSLVAAEVVWILLFFVTLFTFQFKWLMLVCVGVTLNGANLYGYIRCKVGARSKLSSLASNFLGQQVLRSMFTKSTTTEEASTSDT